MEKRLLATQSNLYMTTQTKFRTSTAKCHVLSFLDNSETEGDFHTSESWKIKIITEYIFSSFEMD